MSYEKNPVDSLRAPEPISPAHDLSQFESSEQSLDDWLRRRAWRNESRGASRTYVVCSSPDNRVVGYYCLATGAVEHAVAPGRIRRNMPEPIPVMVIGRLAVDRSWQGRGLGQAMLQDAILRTIGAAQIAGIRAILVHAISEPARRFYQRAGFHASPIDPMTLMVTVAEVQERSGEGPE